MKHFKKAAIILLCGVLAAGMGTLASCASDEDAGREISGLRGSFTYQETIGDTVNRLTISNDPATATSLYCSYEPFSRAWDTSGPAIFSYAINQQIRLKADYTYVYKYSVVISNPNTWGSEIGRMEADVSGTFTYDEEEGGVYAVHISKPTGGTLAVYGIDANGLPGASDNAYYWHWRVHTEPDYVQDFSRQGADLDYTYASGRTIRVDRGSKTLEDNMFLPHLFNEMAKYGNY